MIPKRLYETLRNRRPDLSGHVAELYDFLGYAGFAETSVLRVRFLLGKLDSDRRNGTDFFTHKFMGKTEAIFSALPSKKEWHLL
jgi:hypothetical protein